MGSQSSESLTWVNQSVIRKNRISRTAIDKWFPTRDYFISRGHLAKFGDNFGCHSWGAGLASSRWRPMMLLNLPHSPHNKESPNPKC